MSKEKTDTQFDDAQGNTHKHFADGRAEIYYGGFDKNADYAEVTDNADKMVNRKRFVRTDPRPIEETLMTRDDPEDAIPGLDSLDSDAEQDES